MHHYRDLLGGTPRGKSMARSLGRKRWSMSLFVVHFGLDRIPEGLAEMQTGRWEGWAPTAHLGGRIGGRRLGILGMGRIGQAVARRANVFGMQVHYHNRRRLRPEVEADLRATYWESLDQMLARMDVVSLNCPATKDTHHLLSAERLPRLGYVDPGEKRTLQIEILQQRDPTADQRRPQPARGHCAQGRISPRSPRRRSARGTRARLTRRRALI